MRQLLLGVMCRLTFESKIKYDSVCIVRTCSTLVTTSLYQASLIISIMYVEFACSNFEVCVFDYKVWFDEVAFDSTVVDKAS